MKVPFCQPPPPGIAVSVIGVRMLPGSEGVGRCLIQSVGGLNHRNDCLTMLPKKKGNWEVFQNFYLERPRVAGRLNEIAVGLCEGGLLVFALWFGDADAQQSPRPPGHQNAGQPVIDNGPRRYQDALPDTAARSRTLKEQFSLCRVDEALNHA